MIIDVNKIEELLKSNITSYQIAKATGIATQSLDNYRKYDSKLENMRLGIALKLYNYAKQVLK
ncbi:MULTISPECIES: hypothetical protein [Aerococcus]|uniref:XRE family transcriptional regulator n=2 Tax=Aerococcus TaxID=1375 RepID=A0A1E9PE42_9LACT|nr:MULTISPECIES: hypothetical protein [Aerococcus]KAA9239034.1 hypothetical protein F6I34_07185 [Aerococcus urinae]KAA9292380.1 hypothetical protein F6I06_03715 [Aerococcus mictus]KAA9298438.1 hypothetical protein F6I08_05860 [Aerococcus tenax]MCY3034179.1 hypothetical protein [Aerococcus mictus]MCY3063952.1 hypothetical protein [Aerococcus mictus]